MNVSKSISLVVFILFAKIALSCTCVLWDKNFCQSISSSSNVAIVTVLEEVIDTTIYGLTPVVRVLVLEDLHNEIQKDTLTIQGGYGANCKEKVHYLFNVGDTLIIGVDIDDGVAQLGFCVRQWLRLIDDQVIGRIAPNASTMTLDDFRGNLEACIGMTYSFDVSIFPNPASDVVSVTIENQDLLTHSVYVVSSDGRILRSIEDTYESSLSFSISNLSSGIYFVQATNSEGTFTSLKFIKP